MKVRQANRMSDDLEKGEVAGSFLLGLVASFSHLNIVPEELHLDEVIQNDWYPYSRLMEVINLIKKNIPHSEIILFYAGINFMRIWYEHGPGKTMIYSGVDWLYANKGSGGYNSVVRGGNRNDIGWCLLRSIDEEAGTAVYENVMPLPPDFVRGVFYGGCMIFEDMEYVEVDSISESYQANLSFNKFVLTVRYRVKSKEISNALDGWINDAQVGRATPLDPAQIEMLIWRNKGMQVKIALEMAYHQAIGELLANSITSVRQTARELVKRNTEIEYLANYDVLTGLPTRRLALERLTTICRLEPEHPTKTAVLFIDLDGFKACNDRFGHDAGDHVLKTVAERLLKCLRPEDTVARMGGDEFLVLAYDVSESGISTVASKIIKQIARPIKYKTHRLEIGSSIGIVITDKATSSEVLLKRADQAMYRVKARGKNDFAFDDAA